MLDFFCPELRLAVELDGGQHTDPDVQARDAERTEALASRGIRLIRFSNRDVLQTPEAVAEELWLTCQRASGDPGSGGQPKQLRV